ncbi:hypothetical protein [Streptomyces sp. NPDC048521]|uniref:hypothetical protein n=1 Tax=Streptomyces sp. NPDC048521 TaxID=3365566 RepID=UPI00371B4CBD
MAGRTWEPTKRGAKDLNRFIRKGTTVYTINEMATRVARYEDSHTYTAHTFDRQSRITGEWMTGHLSVSGLLGQCGTVYEQPPAGMRDLATPGRQVAGPLPKGYVGHLDEAELRGLEKQVADMPDPKKRRFGR